MHDVIVKWRNSEHWLKQFDALISEVFIHALIIRVMALHYANYQCAYIVSGKLYW